MIRSFVFSNGLIKAENSDLGLLRVFLADADTQIWVDADQPTEAETKGLLESVFNFHPLAIEDCVTVSERPKVDEYDNYLFVVIHAVDFTSHEFRTRELNIFIGKNFLVTFHRDPLSSINATVDRVKKNSTAIARAPDRLTYTILDFLLDNYEPALAEFSMEIEDLEKDVLMHPSMGILSRVSHLKMEVQRLRQIVFPQREVIARIAHGEFKIVRTHLLPYYRDLLDRLVRINDLADNYRDSLSNTLQINLNIQQMEINKVIKVLTVLATLSVPLLGITSFYGMNIQHMPNVEGPAWYWSYAYIFIATGMMTWGIYWYLRRKKWM